MNYTDAELEGFLDDLEADFLERKESWSGDAPERGRQAVCAFANDLPDHQKAGVLFVGVDDKGVPIELPITDTLLQTLSDIKSDGKTLPPPTIVVQKRHLKGVECAVVIVAPSDAPPVRYSGRTWIRIGPRRGLATIQDERILNEKRRHRDLPFDVQPVPSATVVQLSRALFEGEYLPNAFARDVLDANERSYEERLASCRMISPDQSPLPTIMGLLTIGTSPRDLIPGAYIEFLRFSGTTLADEVVDQQTIDGPISQVLVRIDEKLDAHNQVAIDFRSTQTETRASSYPRVALQQFVRNATMHRTYEGTNAPIRVYWFEDRIEIMSPGGPFGTVTAENFGSPGITDYRNPHLAEALKVYGFVQRFGVGIASAQAALTANGNPKARFTVEQNHVLVTVHKK